MPPKFKIDERVLYNGRVGIIKSVVQPACTYEVSFDGKPPHPCNYYFERELSELPIPPFPKSIDIDGVTMEENSNGTYSNRQATVDEMLARLKDAIGMVDKLPHTIVVTLHRPEDECL